MAHQPEPWMGRATKIEREFESIEPVKRTATPPRRDSGNSCEQFSLRSEPIFGDNRERVEIGLPRRNR
jgi:hypothetical protein